MKKLLTTAVAAAVLSASLVPSLASASDQPSTSVTVLITSMSRSMETLRVPTDLAQVVSMTATLTVGEQ